MNVPPGSHDDDDGGKDGIMKYPSPERAGSGKDVLRQVCTRKRDDRDQDKVEPENE